MDIEVQILNKVITLKEPSFNDYKSLVKNLQTTDNFINALNSFLENFTEVKSLNLLEKNLLLLNLRGLILGNELELNHDEKDYVFDINKLLDIFDKPYEYYEKEINGNVYTFDYIKDIYSSDNRLNFICDGLIKINGHDIDISLEEKLEILPAINFIDLFDEIYNSMYTKDEIKLPFVDDPINITNLLSFVVIMFKTDLLDLYKLEYICRKALNFNTLDFNTLTLPECRILLNFHNEDIRKENEQYNKLNNKQ